MTCEEITREELQFIEFLRAEHAAPRKLIIDVSTRLCAVTEYGSVGEMPIQGVGATISEAWSRRAPTSFATQVSQEEMAAWRAEAEAKRNASPGPVSRIVVLGKVVAEGHTQSGPLRWSGH